MSFERPQFPWPKRTVSSPVIGAVQPATTPDPNTNPRHGNRPKKAPKSHALKTARSKPQNFFFPWEKPAVALARTYTSGTLRSRNVPSRSKGQQSATPTTFCLQTANTLESPGPPIGHVSTIQPISAVHHPVSFSKIILCRIPAPRIRHEFCENSTQSDHATSQTRCVLRCFFRSSRFFPLVPIADQISTKSSPANNSHHA